MPTEPINIVASVLALVGAVGVSTVPLRAWTLVARRRIWERIGSRGRDLAIAAIPLVAILGAVVVGSFSLPRVYMCLFDAVCGPSRASGLVALAVFGCATLALEAAWAFAGFIQRQTRSAAT